MALNQTATVADANTAIDAFAVQIAGGTIEIYDDTGVQPADPSVAITDQILLAVVNIPNPATTAPAANRSAALKPMPAVSAVASGNATWARFKDSGGVARRDGSVGTANADVIVDTIAIVAGAPVSVTGGAISVPAVLNAA